MLGVRLRDPEGIETETSVLGLGLLPVETTFQRDKLVRRATLRFQPNLTPQWSALAGMQIEGYEIRHGRTVAIGASRAATDGELGWVRDGVLGITVHGLFEAPEVLSALFGRKPSHSLDSAIDAMTDVVVANLDMSFIDALVSDDLPARI